MKVFGGRVDVVVTHVLRTVTAGWHRTAVEHPLAMSDAPDLCEQWWNARECRPVAVDAEVGVLFLTWMHEHKLGRQHLLDTLLVASYHCARVQRLATTDWRDFAAYGVFELERF